MGREEEHEEHLLALENDCGLRKKLVIMGNGMHSARIQRAFNSFCTRSRQVTDGGKVGHRAV